MGITSMHPSMAGTAAKVMATEGVILAPVTEIAGGRRGRRRNLEVPLQNRVFLRGPRVVVHPGLKVAIRLHSGEGAGKGRVGGGQACFC